MGLSIHTAAITAVVLEAVFALYLMQSAGTLLLGTVIRSVRTGGGNRRRQTENSYISYCQRQLLADLGLGLRSALLDVVRHGVFVGLYDPLSEGGNQFSSGILASLWFLVLLPATATAFVSIAILEIGLIAVCGSVCIIATSEALLLRFYEASRMHATHCPTCRTVGARPQFQCPSCTRVHADLRPGPLGGRWQRCACDEAALGTLDVLGRRSLPALCAKGHPLPPSSGAQRECMVEIVSGAASQCSYLRGVMTRLGTLTGAQHLSARIEDQASLASCANLMSGHARSDEIGVFVYVSSRLDGKGGCGILLNQAKSGTWEHLNSAQRRSLPIGTVGILLLLSPRSLLGAGSVEGREVYEPMPTSDADPDTLLAGVLAATAGNPAGRRRVPLAIVVLSDGEVENRVPRIGNDEQREVAASADIRTWLMDLGEHNFVTIISQEFKNARYFAVDTTEDHAKSVLHPVFWLVNQTTRSDLRELSSTNRTFAIDPVKQLWGTPVAKPLSYRRLPSRQRSRLLTKRASFWNSAVPSERSELRTRDAGLTSWALKATATIAVPVILGIPLALVAVRRNLLFSTFAQLWMMSKLWTAIICAALGVGVLWLVVGIILVAKPHQRSRPLGVSLGGLILCISIPVVAGSGFVASRLLVLGGVVGSPVTVVSTPSGNGYWLVSANGQVVGSGDAAVYATNRRQLDSVVDMAPTPHGKGYWLVTQIGNVSGIGNARVYGAAKSASGRVVGIVGAPDGLGYWITDNKGQVSAFGDAENLGSVSTFGIHVDDIIGIAATPDGKGYWLAGSDGGIFTFGDARFFGPFHSLKLDAPIVGIVASPDGMGYTTVGADGGVFAFGSSHFFGSLAKTRSVEHVVGIALEREDKGYVLARTNGATVRLPRGP